MNVQPTQDSGRRESRTQRERQSEETRNRLIDAALCLFAGKGYDATPVKEIAQQAGVAPGLIYHYFSGKEEMLWAVLKERGFATRLHQFWPTASSRPAAEVLREVAYQFNAFLITHQAYMRLLMRELQTNAKVAEFFNHYLRDEAKAFDQYLQARIAAGELRPHDTEVTIRLLFWPIVMLNIRPAQSLLEDAEMDKSRFLDSIIDTLLNGIHA